MRIAQQARRDAGLDVLDRIALTVDAPDDVVAAARAHEAFIAGETLALDVDYAPVADGASGAVGDGVNVRVGVVRVEERHAPTRRPTNSLSG